MTPRKVVFSFEESQIINDKLLSEIVRVGHSRFPVYSGDKDNVVGILYSKHLIGDKTLGKEIKAVMQRGVQVVTEDESLDDALDIFLKTHKHIAIVKDEFGGVSGVITLEDIIEEILKKEIVDESDVHDDMREFAKEAAQHE
jgi:CBS domain containing-hemolysin-like protein